MLAGGALVAGEHGLAAARRAYPIWHESFNYLFVRHNTAPPKHQRPPHWDDMAAQGRAIAGSPRTVAERLAERLEISAANYLVGYGWKPGLPKKAKRKVIWGYNRSDAYIDTILFLSEKLENRKN